MKKMIATILAVMLAFSSLAGATAQDAGIAFATGVNSPATLFDDRGNAVATVEVTDINNDWTEYADNSAPDRGYVYLAITVSVTNLGEDELDVRARDFMLFDSLGLNVGPAHVSAMEDASMQVFNDQLLIAGGESAEGMLVFPLFTDVTPGVLQWWPTGIQTVSFNLTDGSQDPSAVVQGMNTTATSTDERGNPSTSLVVTNVTDDWQEFDTNQQPDRGARYVAVDFTYTNHTDAELRVNPNQFALLDAEGAANSYVLLRQADGSDTERLESTEVAPGESLDATLVFHLFEGVEPVGVVMQADSGLFNLVILMEMEIETAATPVASPEATPAGD